MGRPGGSSKFVNAVTSIVQTVVQATSHWPVAGSLYRSIYHSAARAVGDLTSREPRLAGIYARNSYALGTWEPGRSDIDLTAIWSGPNPESAASFHAAFATLKKRFPMLGEVEMLDERHLAAWSGYGVPGLESARWKTLGGPHRFQCRYAGNERLDRVRHAVSIYCHQFMPRFWEQPRQEKTLRRLAAKISRQLNEPSAGGGDAGQLLEACLRKLSRAAAEVTPRPEQPLVDYTTLLGPLPVRPVGTPPQSGDLHLLAAIGHAQGKPRHVVAHEGFRAAALAARFHGATILSPEVFRFYLCFVDPLEHFTLLRERTIVEGIDPLAEPIPLSHSALRETVCHYAADMLTFPYRAGLDTMPAAQFRHLLYGWFLRTLKYFEDGHFTFEYDRLREHFGARHEESAPRFALVHAIANDLSQHMLR